MDTKHVIELDEKNMKHGVMGLVLALVEIIRDIMRLQAIKRIEGERVTEEEIEKLGCALEALDVAIEELKKEQGVVEEVTKIRTQLDSLANDLVYEMVHPQKWKEAYKKEEGLVHATRRATE